MPYSEATGRRLAEVATLRVVEDAMGLGAALAVAAVTPTHGKTPLRLAWQEPVDLLPPGLLHNLIDVRDSILPHRQGTHTIRPVLPQMMSWGSSHLDHRERLRAGMAELNAELYSSWRALVDSGAI
ncbi:hypothetical protein Vretifemale_6678 [Volvox reticuliferus]|nr:hypothetical protein Vretifemale_6678 [Volvox reticuliferus]